GARAIGIIRRSLPAGDLGNAVVSFKLGFLLTGALVFTLVARPAHPSGISGEWNFKVSAPDGDHDARLSVTQDGQNITGTFAGDMGEFKVDGAVKGGELQFVV